MNLKQLKSKLGFIKKAGKFRPILANVLVHNSVMRFTDLETHVTIKDCYGLSEGLHGVETMGILPSNTVDVDDYPASPNSDVILDKVTISWSDLEYLNKFASDDETRIYLNGVAFNNSHMVATNGHVLHRVKTSELENEYILSRESVRILVSFLKSFKFKKDEKITIAFTESWAFIENEKFTLSSRLINRDFPKWQSAIPSKFAKEFTLDNFPKLSEIKPLLNKKTYAIELHSEGGQVTLKCPENPEYKRVVGTCDHDFEIAFNMNYVDLARNKSSVFKIEYNNNLSPSLVNGAIVMPLKL